MLLIADVFEEDCPYIVTLPMIPAPARPPRMPSEQPVACLLGTRAGSVPGEGEEPGE